MLFSYLDTYAVLLHYNLDHLGSGRHIYTGTPASIFLEMKPEIEGLVEELLTSHWEELCGEELFDLFQCSDYSDGIEGNDEELEEREMDVDDVRKRFTKNINEYEKDDSFGISPLSQSKWYKDLTVINDYLHESDFVQIDIEGDYKSFAKLLLENETKGYYPGITLSYVPPYEWIGKLAIICAGEDHIWNYKETTSALIALIDEFNEENQMKI